VARDKRTRRADARRRYREQLRTETEAVPAEAIAETSFPSRPSILDTLNGLLKLPDVGADVRALPWIARHTLAFALPLGAMAVAFVLALDPNVFRLDGSSSDSATVTIGRAAFQFLLVPPAVTAVFVAAVLTPRAGWLVGTIVGEVSIALFLLLLAIHGPTTTASTGTTPTTTITPAVAVQQLLLWLPIYLILGAFAGWYRKFLMGMNARNRQRADDRRKEEARGARRTKAAPARR
jgi:hypothetical protein